MRTISLIATLLFFIGSAVLAEVPEPSRVIIKTRLATEYSAKKQTVIFTLEPGFEKVFGTDYPILKVLVLPLEANQVPIQISLVAENGKILSSTTVYYTPETGAEFSLDVEGIDAQGQVSSFSRSKPE